MPMSRRLCGENQKPASVDRVNHPRAPSPIGTARHFMAPPIAPTRCTACGGCPIALSRMLPTAGLLLVVLAVASCSAPTGLHGTASPRPSSPTAMHAPPYRPMVSITQAWGPNAATDTFSTQLDATHYMP